MKLLTLNCHSLLSPAYSRDCENFVREVLRLRPDLIALQEVNQTRTAPPAAGDLAGWTPPAAGALLRADNHALRVARMLQEAGWPVHWTWTFAKIGYGRYEEGLALLSPGPLAQAEDWFITRSRDPENWKVRKALTAARPGASASTWAGGARRKNLSPPSGSRWRPAPGRGSPAWCWGT